eukprot:scaffold48809_cov75-Phaeocystis_antarctica.AAC.16
MDQCAAAADMPCSFVSARGINRVSAAHASQPQPPVGLQEKVVAISRRGLCAAPRSSAQAAGDRRGKRTPPSKGLSSLSSKRWAAPRSCQSRAPLHHRCACAHRP